MTTTSRADGRLWPVVLACAAVGWFFRDALLLRGAFFVQDVMVQNVPFRHHLHTALSEGRLPLWVPEINGGFPLFAEGQVGALYPLNLLLASFVSPWQAVNLSVVLHLMLAASTMVLLLRRWRALPSAALVGGLSYGLSGYLVVRAMSPNFLAVAAWLPLLLHLVDVAIVERRRRPLLWIAFIVALQLLAGHPQATLYGAAAVLLFAVLRTRQTGFLPRTIPVVLTMVGGVWLAAVQILPTLELTAHSLRSSGLSYERFVQMSMAPERLATLILPSLLGNSASGTYWGAAGDFFIQMCPYLGVLALPLVAIAVIERREAVSSALGILVAIGLVLSMGRYTGLFEALHNVPGLDSFRIPTRFLLWWAVAGAALTGLGADRLLRGPVRRGHWLISGLLLLVCLSLAVALLRQLPAADPGPIVQLWRTEFLGQVVRASVLLLIMLLLVATDRWRGPAGRAAVGIALPLVVLADLSAFGSTFNAVIRPDTYERLPATAAAILEDCATPDDPALTPAAHFRIASLVTEASLGVDWHGGWRLHQDDYALYPETLRIYTGGLYGLANALPGWSPLHLARHWELARLYPAHLPLASVAYVIEPGHAVGGLSLPPELPLTVRRITGLPRAYVVNASVVLPDGIDRLRVLRDGFDPTRYVMLEKGEALRPAVPAALQAATISAYESGRVVVDLPPRSEPGYLVLTDTDYPGWHAWVDGRPTPIETANHAFRAVRVEAHSRQVRFAYEPDAFRHGVRWSLLAVVLWGTLMWQAHRHDRRTPRPSPIQQDVPIISRAWLIQGTLIFLLYGLATRTPQWLVWQQRLDLDRLMGF